MSRRDRQRRYIASLRQEAAEIRRASESAQYFEHVGRLYAAPIAQPGPSQFRCDVCGGVFEKGRQDEDAAAEARDRYGDVPIEECGIVCDDCAKACGFIP